MASELRQKILKSFMEHAEGHISKHKANVEVYLENPVGVGEHPDIIEAIEKEMNEIAKYDDLKEMTVKYFVDKT